MGRRELLIALVFVVVGIVAYQFSAPPAKTANTGFSLARIFDRAKKQIHADDAQASFTSKGTIAAAAGLSEVRLAKFNRGITVIGETRSDITYELKVDSNGPDQDTALSYAKRTVISTDDLGSALAVAADYPSEGSQSAELTLHVPSRLSIRLDNSSTSHLKISNVAGVRFESTTGEATLDEVAGPVTGQYRSGSLSVSRASSVDLTLSATTLTLTHIAQKVLLSARAGRGTLTDVDGAIEIDATGTDFTIGNPGGTVHVGASGGHIKVQRPRASVDVEGKRATVDVTLTTGVPMTILTTEETLHLWFDGAPPAIALDATTMDGGSIRADDPRLVSTGDAHGSKLTHNFGTAAAPRVVLRNQRADIVIGPVK